MRFYSLLRRFCFFRLLSFYGFVISFLFFDYLFIGLIGNLVHRIFIVSQLGSFNFRVSNSIYRIYKIRNSL